MVSLSSARAYNTAFSLPSLPVAIFVGGTSGIGQATAQAFANYAHGNAHIIIVGRNRAAADAIIATFPKPIASGAIHEFVECDATSMKNVHETTAALRARLQKVNLLVLSAGFVAVFRGREDTTEGIDRRMALSYYSRWAFTHDLAPPLEAAGAASELASVLSVFAAGRGGAIDLADLGLRNSYSTYAASLSAPSTYNDIMCEEFAARYPSVAFTHMHPGVVRTPILRPSIWALRPIVTALLYPISSAPEVCAEYILYALLCAEKGKAVRRDSKAGDVGPSKYGGEAARAALWEHTKTATQAS